MYILFPPLLHMERLLWQAARYSLFAGGVLITIWFLVFRPQPATPYATIQPPVAEETFSLERLGEGALARAGVKKPLPPDITKEVVFLATNERPGSRQQDLLCLLSLQSSQERCLVKPEERIYLSCDPLAGHASPIYHFSKIKTPLWVRLICADKQKALLETGLFALSSESESFQEETSQFLLEKHSYTTDSPEKKPLYIEQLEKAKILGQDLFLARCKEDAYANLKNKVKLQVTRGDRKQLLYFLGEKDLLQWSGVNWIPVHSEAPLEGKPLAQVQAVSPKSLVIEVWDEEGFSHTQVHVESSPPGNRSLSKMDFLPCSVQIRADKQMVCQFDKKRYFVHEGDCLVKTARGWKKLKNTQDFADYVHYRIQGELLIFESLVQESGKLVCKGLWIDSTRSQSQSFSLPVVAPLDKKKNSSHNRQKEELSKRLLESYITYLPPSMDNTSSQEGPQ